MKLMLVHLYRTERADVVVETERDRPTPEEIDKALDRHEYHADPIWSSEGWREHCPPDPIDREDARHFGYLPTPPKTPGE